MIRSFFRYLFRGSPSDRIPRLPRTYSSDRKVADVAIADLYRLQAKSAIRSEADAGRAIRKYGDARTAIRKKDEARRRPKPLRRAWLRLKRLL